ncbi:hypothetical protein E2C01_075193 [Portunus trituberculatus]|uniref:Uncharacterized protein n=1 Tax=Portunus trituberculatus TaxID=210409 RepID=A0A5B7I7V8_PORTR|nr:hypothetical protein [Portunus trituberculatus]
MNNMGCKAWAVLSRVDREAFKTAQNVRPPQLTHGSAGGEVRCTSPVRLCKVRLCE